MARKRCQIPWTIPFLATVRFFRLVRPIGQAVNLNFASNTDTHRIDKEREI